MAISTLPMQNLSNSELSRTEYNSKTLQIYLDYLDRYPDAQLLDLGPVCNENIIFFAKRIRKFSVCDMFFRLYKHQRKGLSPEKIWNHLNYQPHSFNGIHLWDFIDRIDDNDAVKLAELCYTMLKPKGMVMAISFDEQSVLPQINSFVIQDNYRLTLRLQPHIDLPWYYRNIRTLTSLLSTFTPVKSFLYRNGVREMLFCRD